MTQLSSLDRDRALNLKQRTEALFGPLPELSEFRDDPCAADYLVGSGGQTGRRGSCTDRTADGVQGPRLVVVPSSAEAGSFAITRQEVSWAELAPFCAATGECAVAGAADQPVSGVPVETALAFAAWLSGQTGFHYRLPSYQEWLQAAQGTSDPNRNCQVQLGSVHRGLAPVAVATGVANGYGLVNVLGNVQEWVLDGEEVKAAGGGYRDPIAECAVGTVRAQRGTADPATGFRLVREVS
jgi:formylglycine-generating enzyme required for sulfatase activity